MGKEARERIFHLGKQLPDGKKKEKERKK